MLEGVESPLAHGLELRPRRILQQRLLKRLHGVRRVGALEHDEDVVGLGGDDGLEAEVLEQALVAVRDVYAAEVREHLAEDEVPAALDLAAHARGADAEHRGRLAGLPRDGRVRLGAHGLAVLGVVLLAAGQRRADAEHVEIVVERLHVEVGDAHASSLEGVLKLEIRGGVAACED